MDTGDAGVRSLGSHHHEEYLGMGLRQERLRSCRAGDAGNTWSISKVIAGAGTAQKNHHIIHRC
ncbi:MAG: hypothetical protein R2860_13255 [Desulfobacterales bacterium]